MVTDRKLLEAALDAGVVRFWREAETLDTSDLLYMRRTPFTSLEVLWDSRRQQLLGGVRSIDGVELSAGETRAELEGAVWR